MASVAQNTKTVNATYTYYASESVSVEAAKRTALTRAQLQAISDAFGTIVTQTNSTIVSNTNGNSDSRFFSTGMSNVKGEWIKTLSDPKYTIEHKNNQLVVTCSVKGVIREIANPEIELDIKLLRNGTELKYEAYDYCDGDNIYVRFMSSVDGHVALFLRQNREVYRLLPYKNSKDLGYATRKGEPYIFFSEADDDKVKADEYELYADNDIDLADLIVYFSPYSPGNMPVGKGEYGDALSTDIDSFIQWLVDRHTKDPHSRVITIPLTIAKNNN